jgi:hypothetical protein
MLNMLKLICKRRRRTILHCFSDHTRWINFGKNTIIKNSIPLMAKTDTNCVRIFTRSLSGADYSEIWGKPSLTIAGSSFDCPLKKLSFYDNTRENRKKDYEK